MYKFLIPIFLTIGLVPIGCSLLLGEAEIPLETEVQVSEVTQSLITFGDYLQGEQVQVLIEKIRSGEPLDGTDIQLLKDITLQAYATFTEVTSTISSLQTEYEQYQLENPESTPLEFWIQIILVALSGFLGGPLVVKGISKSPILIKYGTMLAGPVLSKLFAKKEK